MVRTSVTIDEAVGTLMGWVNGPVLFQSASDDPTQEEQDIVDEAEFLVSDALEDLLSRLEIALIESQEEGHSASVIAAKRAALEKHAEMTLQARAYYCAVNDEINRGEQSSLRVDTARSNAHCTYITLTSLNEWAIDRFGISFLATINKSTPPVHEFPAKPADARVKMRDQEDAILAQIGIQGIDPKSMPPLMPGRSGVKNAVRTALSASQLFGAKKSFDKAWERLRADRSIEGGS